MNNQTSACIVMKYVVIIVVMAGAESSLSLDLMATSGLRFCGNCHVCMIAKSFLCIEFASVHCVMSFYIFAVIVLLRLALCHLV